MRPDYQILLKSPHPQTFWLDPLLLPNISNWFSLAKIYLEQHSFSE